MTESTERVHLRQIAGEQFKIITRRDGEHLHWRAFKVGNEKPYATGKTDARTDKEVLTEIAWGLFGTIAKPPELTAVGDMVFIERGKHMNQNKRDDIMDALNASRWEWIEIEFVGLTVARIEYKLDHLFGIEGDRKLAQAIHDELN